MSATTGISWTDATWNPWYGCHKVSPGCRGCYMYRDMAKYGRDPLAVKRSKSTFRDPLKWKDPKRVFTCSWSDFFHEQADEWRADAWDIIRRTPHLTYQILTKRPENIATRLPEDWFLGYSNVWLGVSAESQVYYDLRVPILCATPAVLRFVSLEPLLGPIVISNNEHLGWVIVGGESGPNHRPLDVDWIRAIEAQCNALPQIPMFVKQDSGHRPGQQGRIPDRLWARKEWPAA